MDEYRGWTVEQAASEYETTADLPWRIEHTEDADRELVLDAGQMCYLVEVEDYRAGDDGHEGIRASVVGEDAP
jgi:hypothetical protein